MKKVTIFDIILISTLLTFSASCSFQIPEKVSIKSKAEYEFGLMNVNKSLDEQLDKEKLFGDIKKDHANAEFYDYIPNSEDVNTRHYLLKLPLYEIPIDFGKYIEDLNFKQDVEGLNFNEQIKVPNLDVNKSIDFYIEGLQTSVNTLLAANGVAGQTGVETYIPAGLCTSVTYVSGTVTVAVPGGGDVVFLGETKTASAGGSVSFDLAGKTINSTVAKPQVNSAVQSYVITDPVLESVNGFNSDTPVPVTMPSVDFKLTEENAFKNCVVETGKLNLDFQLPEGITYEGKLDFTGGLTKSSTIDNSSKEINLNDSEIKPEDVHLAISNFELTKFENVNLDFTTTPKITVSSAIEKLKTITVQLDIQTQVEKTVEFPAEAKKMVKSVNLATRGLKGTYKNTLPTGNDININLVSEAFGISNGTGKLSANKTEETAFEILEESPLKMVTNNPIVFTADIKLPKASPADPGTPDNEITVQNVELGKTYNIELKLEPVFDWTSVEIDSKNIDKQIGNFDLGISLGKVLQDFGTQIGIDLSGVGIPNVPIYISCVRPDLSIFKSTALEGTMEMAFGAAPENTLPLIGDGDSITFVTSLPNLVQNDKKAVTTDLSKETFSISKDLGSFITKSMASSDPLKVNYQIGVKGVGDGSNTIKVAKTDIEKSSNSSIAVIAYIDLPLKLDFGENEKSLNLKEMMKLPEGEDLFKREKAWDLGEMEKYLEVIKDVELGCDLKNIPFYSETPLKLTANLVDASGNSVLNKELNLKQGTKVTANLTKEEAKAILKTYPCVIGDLSIKLPTGNVSLPVEAVFNSDVSVKVRTDGTIDIFGGTK